MGIHNIHNINVSKADINNVKGQIRMRTGSPKGNDRSVESDRSPESKYIIKYFE